MILPFDDPITAKEIGQALRYRRLVRDISQQKLAELVHLPRHKIDNWENGYGLLQTVNIFAAFEACGCDVKIVPCSALKLLIQANSRRGC